ncbi:hypothetical protein ABK040_015801 [Willaertia magna]
MMMRKGGSFIFTTTTTILFMVTVIACLAIHIVHGQQNPTVQTFNKAIYDLLQDLDSEYGFRNIHWKYFGDHTLHAPRSTCSQATWPNTLGTNTTISGIVNRKYIVFGANSVTNIPKRFNCTGTFKSIYGTVNSGCTGFEADIAASIARRIGQQYTGTPFPAYFAKTSWYNTEKDNIIQHLNNNEFDIIVSGLSLNGTWNNTQNVIVDKSTLVDFTCPYFIDDNGIVKGKLALPIGAVPMTNFTTVDQIGIKVCVQKGTSMEQYANTYLKKATVVAFVDGMEPVYKTQAGDVCHAYVAPIMNALWQGKNYENLTYVDVIGDPVGSVAVGIRKESISSASVTMICSLLYVIVFVLFGMFL